MFTTIEINKDNLINNFKQVKSKNPNSKICAMVKANAYGVGAKQAVQILNEFVDYFGVACFFEAKNIKKYSTKPILIVGSLEKNQIDLSFEYSCSDLEDIKYLKGLNQPIKIHLKINTGMNRFGFSSFKDFKLVINEILTSKLILKGIFTHFATDDVFVEKQNKKFVKFVKYAKQIFPDLIIHADNSAVSLKFSHKYDMVRVGYNLFCASSNGFKSVLSIKSYIVQTNNIKKGDLVGYNYRFVSKEKMKVAVVPVGYADGFSMNYLGIKLNILGLKCKVLNICMDCFIMDVSKLNIKKGDEIYILNTDNPLKLYSEYINSSEYEVQTKFSNMRAKRKLVSSSSNRNYKQNQSQ